MRRYSSIREKLGLNVQSLPLILAILAVLVVPIVLVPNLGKTYAGNLRYASTYPGTSFAMVQPSLPTVVSAQRNRSQIETVGREVPFGHTLVPADLNKSVASNFDSTSNYLSTFGRFEKSSRQACQLLDIPPPSL